VEPGKHTGVAADGHTCMRPTTGGCCDWYSKIGPAGPTAISQPNDPSVDTEKKAVGGVLNFGAMPSLTSDMSSCMSIMKMRIRV
jgi:hypothetical protein